MLQVSAELVEERQGGCFCRRLSCPTCVTGFDMGRERSSRDCSARGDPWGYLMLQLWQPTAISPRREAQGREHAASWQPCRRIWVEMELAKEEFTGLHLLRLL